MSLIRRAAASMGQRLLSFGIKDSSKGDTITITDRRLLELLGIDPDEISVRGRRALNEATIYACIKILSETVSKLPVKIYQETESGTRKAVDHYLYQLMKTRPNPLMSSSHMFGALETQRNLYGNAVAWMEPDRANGRIKAIWPLDMERVTIVVDDVGALGTPEKVWYVVRVDGEESKLRPDEILHFRTFTLDGLVGIAPTDRLRSLVEIGAYSTDYLNRYFKTGLTARGIVQYVGDLSAEHQENLRKRFEQMASGLKNAHRIVPMPLGFQYQPLSHTLADAQFLENTELTIRQIANAFGIKMHQLNDLSRATHTNIEEQQKAFYVDTLQAILTAYEQELDYKLFLEKDKDQGYFVRFNVDAITRSDIKTRYEAYRVGIHGGFIAPNEVRALEDMPPIEGGDEPFLSKGMVPISVLQRLATKELAKGGDAVEGAADESAVLADPSSGG